MRKNLGRKYTKVAKICLNFAWTNLSECIYPAGIYLFKVNYESTRRMCEIYLKEKSPSTQDINWTYLDLPAQNWTYRDSPVQN